jgi:hypothetical protein
MESCMRRTTLISFLSLIAAGCASAQNTPRTPPGPPTHYPDGTVACKTEATMVSLMHASPALAPISDETLDPYIKRGDCLILPKDWHVLTQKDPPIAQQENHASQWTIRTPQGVVHMWGAPVGSD